MSAPYYQDDLVTLYHGDCREGVSWLGADVLVTDPPYGRGWRQGHSKRDGLASDAHFGIAGDEDTAVRDFVLSRWLQHERIAVVFGDLMLAPPLGTRQVLIYQKPPNAGTRGATHKFRRDVEAVYLIGPWPSGLSARMSSILTTRSPSQGNPSSPQGAFGHPHAKPQDIMETLVRAADEGAGCEHAKTACSDCYLATTPYRAIIADPFAGSGSTLVAAKARGHHVIGYEIDERYCEIAARRLAQDTLFGGAA